MLFTLISRLAMYRSLFSLAESFTDNVIRGTVDEPARGGIVWCELAGAMSLTAVSTPATTGLCICPVMVKCFAATAKGLWPD